MCRTVDQSYIEKHSHGRRIQTYGCGKNIFACICNGGNGMWCRRCILERSGISFKRSMRSTPGSSLTKPFSKRCTRLKSEAGWWFQGILFLFGLPPFWEDSSEFFPQVSIRFSKAPLAQPPRNIFPDHRPRCLGCLEFLQTP